MIYIIDKSVINEVHVVFNSSMLKLLSIIYPEDSLIFMADFNHTKMVKERLGFIGNISFLPIKIDLSFSTGFKKIIEWTNKVFRDFTFFIRFFKKMKDGDILFLLNLPPMSLVFFKIVKLFFPQKRVYLVLHGELEYVYYSNDKREKGIGSFYRLMFRLKAKNLYYILLNKIAKPYLVNDKFIEANQAIEINHPYIFTEDFIGKNELSLNTEPLICANIGSLMMRKNAHLIFKLAEKVKTKIESKNIEIKTIGSVDAEMLQYNNGLVTGIPESITTLHHLDRTEYEKLVQEVDFALFFFNKEQFIFRASGAILDVINFCKPIIAIKHALFESLFEEYGAFGFLVNDMEEMAALLKDMSANKHIYKRKYDTFVDNITQIRLKLSLKSIAYDLKAQIDNL